MTSGGYNISFRIRKMLHLQKCNIDWGEKDVQHVVVDEEDNPEHTTSPRSIKAVSPNKGELDRC